VTLALMAVSWGLGAALGLAVGQPAWAAGICGAAAVGASLLARGGAVRLICLVLAVGSFGALRGGLAPVDTFSQQLAPHLGRATLTGKVLDSPSIQGGRAAFSMEVTRITSAATPPDGVALSPTPIVAVRWAPEVVRAGDVVRVTGRLGEPRSRPGFPQAELLARRGVHHVLAASAAQVVDRPDTGARGMMVQAREQLEAAIRSALPEPHASLTAGVVLGARATLPADLRESLSITGTSHIVAVSGFNVAVAAAAVHLIAVRLIGRPWSALLSVVAIWMYVLLVGAPPSAVRAGLMASLALVAIAVGRLPDAITTLAVAGAAMLLWDPWLFFDLGFQLSVLATAGLVLFALPIGQRLAPLPRPIREPVAVALATHIITLPLVLQTFHTLSLVAPLSNLLVGLTVPWLMLVGALLALLGPIPGLGDLAALGAWSLASATLGAIEWTAALPGAVVYTGRLPVWLAIAWYVALGLWAAAGSPDLRALAGRRLAPVAAVVGVTLALAPAAVAIASGGNGTPSVSLLDTPDSAAFVRTSDGRTALISTPSGERTLVASVAQRLDFWERSIDVAILTHVAPDGGQSFGEALRRYPPRFVAWPSAPDAASPIAWSGETSALAPISMVEGQVLDLGGGVAVVVVDVRNHEDREVMDLSVEVTDGAIWLPGPGRLSPHWQRHVVVDRPIVLRVPTRAATWLRELESLVPSAAIRALVIESASDRAASHLDVPHLDHWRGGAIEIATDGGALTLRPERCAEPNCVLTLD
jgi:competence protein ComEC